MKYATEDGLRVAVEKKIGYKLSDEDWARYAPDWVPPYDGSDVEDVVRQIPRATPKPKGRNIYKAAYVRSGFIPESIKEQVAKARSELFGSEEPPFKDLDSMRTWIMEESKSQPPAKGHAPKYGYRMKKGITLDELQELGKKQLGPIGLEYATLAFPAEGNHWTSHVIVSDGTRLRRLWITVRYVAKRLDCQEAQATALILTGIRPLVAPIIVEPQSTFHADGPSQGKIVITLREPLPVEDVMRYYKKAREKLWGHKRNHQIPNDKDSSLVDFILPRFNPEKPDWEGLRIAWNDQYPDWFFDNWRYLKITYERAYEKIFPPINFGPVTLE